MDVMGSCTRTISKRNTQHGAVARCSSLVLTGKLRTYLADLNEKAKERLDLIIEQIKAAEEMTEELKVWNQFERVGRMNNIRKKTEEIIRSELIYTM